jgi:hypothetical protein
MASSSPPVHIELLGRVSGVFARVMRNPYIVGRVEDNCAPRFAAERLRETALKSLSCTFA